MVIRPLVERLRATRSFLMSCRVKLRKNPLVINRLPSSSLRQIRTEWHWQAWFTHKRNSFKINHQLQENTIIALKFNSSLIHLKRKVNKRWCLIPNRCLPFSLQPASQTTMYQKTIITTMLLPRCGNSLVQVSIIQATCSIEGKEERRVMRPASPTLSMPWVRESALKSSVIRIWCLLMPLSRTFSTTIRITTYNSSHPLSFSYCSHQYKKLWVKRALQVEKQWALSPMSLNHTNSISNSSIHISNRCKFWMKTILKDSSGRQIWL